MSVINVSGVWAEEQPQMRSVAVDSEFLFRPISPDAKYPNSTDPFLSPLTGFTCYPTNVGVNTLQYDANGSHPPFDANTFYSLGETVDQKSMTESAETDLLRSDGGRDLDEGDTPRSVTITLTTASAFIDHDFLIRNRNVRFQGFLRTVKLKRAYGRDESPIMRFLFLPNFQFLRGDQSFPNTGVVRYQVQIKAFPVQDVTAITYRTLAQAFAKGTVRRFAGMADVTATDMQALHNNMRPQSPPTSNQNYALFFKPYRGKPVALAGTIDPTPSSLQSKWLVSTDSAHAAVFSANAAMQARFDMGADRVIMRVEEDSNNPFYATMFGRFVIGNVDSFPAAFDPLNPEE